MIMALERLTFLCLATFEHNVFSRDMQSSLKWPIGDFLSWFQNRILAALLVAAAVTCCAHAFCYDAQVAKDQAFDDSFVCQDDFPYPA